MSEMVFFMMANTTNVGVVGIHSDDLIDCSGSCLKKLAGIYGGLSHDIRARTEESARMAFSNFLDAYSVSLDGKCIYIKSIESSISFISEAVENLTAVELIVKELVSRGFLPKSAQEETGLNLSVVKKIYDNLITADLDACFENYEYKASADTSMIHNIKKFGVNFYIYG